MASTVTIARRRRGQQLTVVADEQDRLARRPQLALQPPLGRDVEEVVGLVEQEDVVVAAQQDLERHALLLAAGERAQRPGGDLVEAQPDGARDALVPVLLGAVPTVVAPVGQRPGVGHRVVDRPLLGGRQALGRGPHARRGQRDEEVTNGRRSVLVAVGRPDQLAHHAEVAVDRQRARRGRQLAGDESHERRLAHTVGTDEGRPIAVADGEVDIGEQVHAAGQPPPEMTDLDRAHERTLLSRRLSAGRRFGVPQDVAQRAPEGGRRGHGVVVLGLGPTGARP